MIFHNLAKPEGIFVDWSDTETKGLREAIGEKVADRLLRGCNVHWARSYQRFADRVNRNVQKSNKKLANEAFKFVLLQNLLLMLRQKEDVLITRHFTHYRCATPQITYI